MSICKIEYWNSCDMANVLYQKQFRQLFFVDAEVIAKEYPLIREGNEDGAGTFYPSYQRMDKVYHMKFIAPEFVCDALNLAQLHDNIKITTDINETGKCIDFTINQTIQKNNLFLIEITFTCEYFKIEGCCINLGLSTCKTVTCDPVRDRLSVLSPVYTNPLANGVHTGYRYLFVNVSGQGKIYKYSSAVGGWVDTGETVINAMVYITHDTDYNWYDGNAWWPRAKITSSVVLGGGSYKIIGIALPKTFVQVQYSTDLGMTWNDFGDPVWSETFRYKGVTDILSTPGLNLIRAHCYTHNCEYGYSANYAIVVP